MKTKAKRDPVKTRPLLRELLEGLFYLDLFNVWRARRKARRAGRDPQSYLAQRVEEEVFEWELQRLEHARPKPIPAPRHHTLTGRRPLAPRPAR